MNTAMEFQEPYQDEEARSAGLGGARVALGAGPETIPFTFDGEEFSVSGFERELPMISSVADRGRLVAAGSKDPATNLSLDDWHAVARAVVQPLGTAVQLRNQPEIASALIEEHVDGATLRSLHARVWLTELFPGLQPRTGQEALPIVDPEVHGATEDGLPLASLAYRYENRHHLQEHLRQTIAFTRRANPNPYDQSILARRITRAVIAHPCRLEFKDGTEPIHVLAVRDGITRITSSWALLAEEGADPERIAEVATSTLLAEKPTRRGSAEKPLSQRCALGRQEELASLHAEFLRGLVGGQPSARAVRIGQTLVVPAQIAVGVQPHANVLLPPDELFDDAVRSILASVHVEFKQWEPAAQNVEVGTRALRRVLLSGVEVEEEAEAALSDIVDLALGRRRPQDLPAIFRDGRIPGTALWRAVYLVHALTRPLVFEQVKRSAKEIKGTRQMRTAGYAELLGPIVDLPWRAAKGESIRQARNAWTNGGVLTAEVMGDWRPSPCADFTLLVEPALRGDPNARATLTVAGGIALIADKLITRNVGSAVGRTVPFRADVQRVVQGLSLQPDGLWLLAHAAQRFEEDRESLSAVPEGRLRGIDATRYYQHVDVDPKQPDGISRDETGAPVQLTPWQTVALSDPEAAARIGNKSLSGQNSAVALTVAEQLTDGRRKLKVALTSSTDLLLELVALAQRPEAGSLQALGSSEEAKELHELAYELGHKIFANKPTDVDEDAVGEEADEE